MTCRLCQVFEQDYQIARRQYIHAVRELLLAFVSGENYRQKVEYVHEAKDALHDCRIAWLGHSAAHTGVSGKAASP
jgi:hypothetical protein